LGFETKRGRKKKENVAAAAWNNTTLAS